ncbi:MAG TPA: type II toxin-antitoxin system RelE/ParE family toxin, partial [Burkholderiaceae bacterium]|nr:type II toxin-antitoxin system RelE/ParE family toxin [Burkholderiaceae bacterium]
SGLSAATKGVGSDVSTMLTSVVHSIEYSREAAKTLKTLPRNVRRLILAKIEDVARDPYAPNRNVSALTGRQEMRLRVQDWRVIYRVQDDRLVLLVIKVGARGQVYE